MAIHVSFFDTTPIEKESFGKYFSDSEYKLSLFSEPIEEVSPYQLKDIEVASIYITSHLDQKILGYMPKLKMVACRSTGFDNLDLPALKKHKVAVANVPGYGATTVAEYAIMLMLALAHKLPKATEAFRSGEVDYNRLTGFTLAGHTLGVIGTGRIGQSVIKIAKAMDMSVIAFDPFEQPDLSMQLGFKYASLDNILKSSDLVTLHAPMAKENFHLINQDKLALMKKGSILINTARGELVDTAALIDALQSKHLAAAGMDVLEGEQVLELDNEIELFRAGKRDIGNLVTEHDILTKMDNVIISPHNAFNTREALEFIRKTTVDNIKGFLEDKPQNIVK